MALIFSSPSVQIQEIDKTQSIKTNNSKVAVIVLAADLGPLNKLTYISSETELVSVFGKPNINNYTEWFSIISLLSYNIIVGVIRPSDASTSLITANATFTGYDSTLQLSGSTDYYNQINNYKFAAQTPTDKFNGYTIKAIDHGADQILTISGATVNNSTISVNDASGLTVDDYIKLGSEYLKITAITGSDITVIRGQLGTIGTPAYLTGGIVTKLNYADSVVLTNIVAVDVPNGNILAAANTIKLSTNIPSTYIVGAFIKLNRVPVGAGATNTSETVKIISIDATTNTLTVQRGQLGDVALLFNVLPTGLETSVVVSTNLLTFNESSTTTTITNDFPSYTIPTFTGVIGDIVKSGSKYGWVFSISANAITVILSDTTKKFKSGDNLYNSDGISIIGTVSAVDDYYSKQYIIPGVPWSSVAPQPGTSIYAAQKGAKFDEMHVAVLDPNNLIVERYTYLSKASDALTAEGTNIYWKSLINNRSTTIFAGTQDFSLNKTITLAIPQNSAFINGALNSNISNTLFSVFKSGKLTSTVDTTISGGTSYNFNNTSVIAAVLDSGYDLVSDSEGFADIDMLVPGKITAQRVNKLIGIVNTRKDCRVCVSPLYSDVINGNNSITKTQDIINFFDTISSTSYAIFDSGYKYVYDKYNDTYYWIPCAADVAGLTLSTEFPWTSPAGVNRGIIKNALKLAYSPKKSERDLLYAARINPIATFPGTGIVLYGDKTALTSPSAFGQIGVRGLFIAIQKITGNYADDTLFEINDDITRSNFSSLVSIYLQNIVDRRGIKEFKVVCDETNNTPTTIDAAQFYCDIYIKPLRSINFIVLTFVAQGTGSTFTVSGN